VSLEFAREDLITRDVQSTKRIRIYYLAANVPEVSVGEPVKARARSFYTSAKSKDDADIFFKGTIVTSSVGDPQYSIDSKAGYFRDIGMRWGSVGGQGTFVVDKAANVDPDSVTLGLSYAKVLVFAPATGVMINADAFGYEYDKSDETRNRRTTAFARLVVPSINLGGHRYLTGGLSGGYELGTNEKSTLKRTNTTIQRTVVGADGYLLIPALPGVGRVDVSASWLIRLLGSPEPFTEVSDTGTLTGIDEDARHLVVLDVALMFAKALGASISYRNGSEPPDFKKVSNRWTFGLTLKLKQSHKG
jgi:hypothetical protein